MELTRQEVRAGLYAVSALRRERALAGRSVPREVVALEKRLDAERSRLRSVSTMSPTRQAEGVVERESDSCATFIGTAEAAAMLGWSTRQVQRYADALGGQKIAGRLVFHEHDITIFSRNYL